MTPIVAPGTIGSKRDAQGRHAYPACPHHDRRRSRHRRRARRARGLFPRHARASHGECRRASVSRRTGRSPGRTQLRAGQRRALRIREGAHHPQPRQRGCDAAGTARRRRRSVASAPRNSRASASSCFARSPTRARDSARYRQLVIDIENNAPPPILSGAGEPDDLKLIVGVGPVLERMLHHLGITTFRQIARWTERDIDEFDAQAARVSRTHPPRSVGDAGARAAPEQVRRGCPTAAARG